MNEPLKIKISLVIKPHDRFCRYLMSYKVSPAPNYWLYSTLRCDGKCDPEDILDIPFRVSPDVNNPPR